MDNFLKILIAGDFAPVKQFGSNVNENLLSNLKIVKEHDHAILNLEGSLTNSNKPIKKYGSILSIDPRWAPIIRENGFDIVSLANNHILDMGDEGLFDTFQHCNAADLKYFGAGKNLSEARQPLIITTNGIQLGILTMAEHEFSIATMTSPGAAPIDPIVNYYDIDTLREKVDFIVLLIHAGNEYYPYPRPGLVKLCHYYVDLGVNAIVCHHTHTALGYELYKDTPIFYGTGNFYFKAISDKFEDWYYGYLVSLKISKDSGISYKLFPYKFDDNKIELLNGNNKQEFYKELNIRSQIIADNVSLTQKWNSFCMNKRDEYLGSLLTKNVFYKLIYRFKLLRPKLSQKKMLLCLNYLRCESHREALINIFQQLISD